MRALEILQTVFPAENWAAVDFNDSDWVRQVYDVKADKADEMYQFVPDYPEIKVGDRVKLLGTVGRHTVHNVRAMLPEGAEKVSIMPRVGPSSGP